MAQCRGTTRKGVRCRIELHEPNKVYCKFHISQRHLLVQPLEKQSSTFTYEARSPNQHSKHKKPISGWIYVYTLEHLLENHPKKKDWLSIKREGKDKSEPFKPKKEILIKVGMTRGTVRKRLREWEAKCSHKLRSVDPYDLKSKHSLISLLKGLSMEEKTKYLNYDTDGQGFKCTHSLDKVEKTIHKHLRNTYGRGDVICQGCKTVNREHGIHVEWFNVPRKDLKKIFQFIDRLIAEI